MFDIFGRVICTRCKSAMHLSTVVHHNHEMQAVFSCTNPTCFEEAAPEWQQKRTVVFGQQLAA